MAASVRLGNRGLGPTRRSWVCGHPLTWTPTRRTVVRPEAIGAPAGDRSGKPPSFWYRHPYPPTAAATAGTARVRPAGVLCVKLRLPGIGRVWRGVGRV